MNNLSNNFYFKCLIRALKENDAYHKDYLNTLLDNFKQFLKEEEAFYPHIFVSKTGMCGKKLKVQKYYYSLIKEKFLEDIKEVIKIQCIGKSINLYNEHYLIKHMEEHMLYFYLRNSLSSNKNQLYYGNRIFYPDIYKE